MEEEEIKILEIIFGLKKKKDGWKEKKIRQEKMMDLTS